MHGQAGEPKAKRGKASRSRSPSYAVEGTRVAPRLSAHAKGKQTCSSCNTVATPQWRHIKMPHVRKSVSNVSTTSAGTENPSSSADDTINDSTEMGEIFITVCNACALRFRKKCCICGDCKVCAGLVFRQEALGTDVIVTSRILLVI